jgi:hypothetical protein
MLACREKGRFQLKNKNVHTSVAVLYAVIMWIMLLLLKWLSAAS